jgi:2-deoxy-scyllo-inosamine dehydrogenase (SAM-dependent)
MKSVIFIINDNRADGVRRSLMLADALAGMDIKSFFLNPTKNFQDFVEKQIQQLNVQHIPQYIPFEVFQSYRQRRNISLNLTKRTMADVFSDPSYVQGYPESNKLGRLLNLLGINNKALLELKVERELTNFICDLKAAEKILDEIKPSCIINNVETPQPSRAFFYAAKQRNISVVSMEQGEGRAEQYKEMPALSDYYIAYSPYNRDILRNMGVDEEKILVTGVQDTDLIYNYNKEAIKEELKRKYQINFEKKIIQVSLRPSNIKFYLSMNIELLNILHDHFAGNHDFEIILKVHPVDLSDYVKTDYCKFYASKYREMKVIEGGFPISKLNAVSDYCLTHKSSVIVEAVLQKVPTIVLDSTGKWPDWNKYGVYIPAKIEELAGFLQDIKNGTFNKKNKCLEESRREFIHYFRYKFDNHSNERIANEIDRICCVDKRANNPEYASEKKTYESATVADDRATAEQFFKSGFYSFREGDFKTAVSYFENAKAYFPQMPELNFALATAYAQSGNFYAAKRACETELMTQPKHDATKMLLQRITSAADIINKKQSRQVNQSASVISQGCDPTANNCPGNCMSTESETCKKTTAAAEPTTSNGADMKVAEIKKNLNNNIFAYTKRVSIELSNLCNYASAHKKCPLHLEKEHVILSRKVVEKVIDSMAKNHFDGTIAFHTYNEPMIDPRLFMFIQYAKKKCPKSKAIVMSNGYYFNQTIADELVEIGVDHIYMTAYSANDRKRLEKIQIDIPYSIQKSELDDRLNLYDRQLPATKDTTPCYAPLNEIIVTRKGQVSLCCLDWNRKHCFGNLYNEELENVILQSDIATVYSMLSEGHKEFAICKSCGWSR